MTEDEKKEIGVNQTDINQIEVTKSHRGQQLSLHEVKDSDEDEAYLSQTVPGPIVGLGPHFSTHLLSLYLPTIPHCRRIHCP
jgi:hypothetical protein